METTPHSNPARLCTPLAEPHEVSLQNSRQNPPALQPCPPPKPSLAARLLCDAQTATDHNVGNGCPQRGVVSAAGVGWHIRPSPSVHKPVMRAFISAQSVEEVVLHALSPGGRPGKGTTGSTRGRGRGTLRSSHYSMLMPPVQHRPDPLCFSFQILDATYSAATHTTTTPAAANAQQREPAGR